MYEYFLLFGKYLPLLLDGLKYTMIIAVCGIALGTVIGIILCVMQIGKNKILRQIAALYVTIIRGIPLMILALFLYFGVIKAALPVLMSAIIILGINCSAFICEVFRSGIEAVDIGQMEAARSLGLSYFQAMRKVILPQAIKITIPALMNQFIASLKDTSILSAISVTELTMSARTIIARTYKAFELYSYAMIIYLVIITALTGLSKYLEKRLSYDKR